MKECLFCKIADKKIPANIEYEDDKVVAFSDINPQAPIHILIIPRKHIESISDIEENDMEMIGRLVLTAKKIAVQKGIHENGFRVVFNSGAWAGQEVMHIHLHLLGGRKMTWPPG